jgi:hypothetical protein
MVSSYPSSVSRLTQAALAGALPSGAIDVPTSFAVRRSHAAAMKTTPTADK